MPDLVRIDTQTASKADESIDAEMVLPTLTRPEMDSLRNSFAARFRDDLSADTDEPNQMAEWEERGLGTRFLPRRLQPEWNEFLKSQVADRLRTWFARKRISPPDDFIYTSSRSADEQGSRGEDLRGFVIDTVRAMSQDELEPIQLPASAMARMRRKRKRMASPVPHQSAPTSGGRWTLCRMHWRTAGGSVC